MYFSTCRLKDRHPLGRVEFRRDQIVGGGFSYSINGHLLDVHHPFAAPQHAVDSPVDEDAKASFTEPLASGQVFGRRCVLRNGLGGLSHHCTWQRGANGDQGERECKATHGWASKWRETGGFMADTRTCHSTVAAPGPRCAR